MFRERDVSCVRSCAREKLVSVQCVCRILAPAAAVLALAPRLLAGVPPVSRSFSSFFNVFLPFFIFYCFSIFPLLSESQL